MLFVPAVGAEVNVRLVRLVTVYATPGSCGTLLTTTSISELADTCLVKVKEVVEPLPLYCAYDVEAY